MTGKFQGEWNHGGRVFTTCFLFRGSAGEMKVGASFSDDPSILDSVSDSIPYPVITQPCILNYLILRLQVFSRLPDAFFSQVRACV